MATVIDALIVELGLDPRKFTAGQKQAMSEARRALEEGKRAGKDIEHQADAINNTLSRLKGSALSFFSLLAGGAGLTAFIVNTTTADAALARFSRSIGADIKDVAAWQKAVESAGGSAEGFNATAASLTEAFQRFESYGDSLPFAREQATLDAESKRLGGMGVSLADAAGKMKPIGEFLKELAFVLQNMDPAKAATFAKAFSITDQGLFNFLRMGPEAMTKLLNEQRKIGVVTKEEAEQAERLAKAWANASQSVVSMGRGLLDVVSPTLIQILDKITKVASQDNDTKLRQDIFQLGRMRDELATMNKGSPRYVSQEKLIKEKEANVETRLRARAELDAVPEPPGPAKPPQLNAVDRDLLVRTVIGEAKGQGEQGQAAVAHVVMNRLQSGRYGGTMEKVLFAPKQFEPWETRKNELMNISPESADYRRTSALVDRVLAGQLADPTKGATHFANEAVVAARGNAAALSWIEQMKRNGTAIQIGAHTFGRPEAQPGAIKPVLSPPAASAAVSAVIPPTAPAIAPAKAPAPSAPFPAPAPAAVAPAPAVPAPIPPAPAAAAPIQPVPTKRSEIIQWPVTPPAKPSPPEAKSSVVELRWPTTTPPAAPAAPWLPPGPLGARPGAPSAAMAASVLNDNRASTTTTTTDIKVENLIVQTPSAADAPQVASDIMAALERTSFASLASANSGPG